jgi:hypothetical protein
MLIAGPGQGFPTAGRLAILARQANLDAQGSLADGIWGNGRNASFSIDHGHRLVLVRLILGRHV